MIDAAIIGLGRWGQALVQSVQGKSDLIRFTAGVDQIPSKAASTAEQYGFPLGDNYEAVLADPAIDVVVLATPHSQHASQIIAAAAVGKHIFVEKPFTLTKASAEDAVAMASRAGVVLALGENRRFLPAFEGLRQRLDAGVLGEIAHVEVSMSGSYGFWYALGTWRTTRKEAPAGGMTSVGIHMVDAMISMFGPIAWVDAQSLRRFVETEVDDTTSMLLAFENGISGYLGTLAASAKYSRFHVFGSKGWAKIDDESRLEIRPIEGDSEVIAYPPFDTERAELEAFANAVAGVAEYPLPLDHAVHGVSVLDATVRSMASGKREPVI